MPARDELFQALKFTVEDRDRLYAALLQRKATVYQQTLDTLGEQYGQPPAVVSGRMRDSLALAALRDANAMINSYNRDLDEQLDAALEASATVEELLLRIEEWSHMRAERQAPVVGITSTYDAYADAQIAFFRNAGVDPGFDFGGHGDDAPACSICQAIHSRNPHPLERVIEIGTPHPQCRQEWHPRRLPGLPANYLAGTGGASGILDKATLIQRAGGRKQAVAAVLRME